MASINIWALLRPQITSFHALEQGVLSIFCEYINLAWNLTFKLLCRCFSGPLPQIPSILALHECACLRHYLGWGFDSR